jgi:hypothetical protein
MKAQEEFPDHSGGEFFSYLLVDVTPAGDDGPTLGSHMMSA